MIELSVVIPIRDEAESLEDLHRELSATLDAWARTYEIIFIDDGSVDRSFEILSRLQAADPQVRVIRFRRNFGQTAAFAAGFEYARGRFIVTSDGDLQNDPRDIPAMVEELERGADVVCGWRQDRKDAFLSRRLPSMTANALISMVTGVRLHDYGCSLKAFNADIVKGMRLYGEMHRFLPAMASEHTSRITERIVNHRPRKFGRSKYGIGRTIRVVLDLLTVKFLVSYATRPLHVFGMLGGAMALLGLLISGWLAYWRLFGGMSLANRPLLLLGIVLILTGVQLVMFGLLAEMLARTYHESQNKPTYSVEQILQSEIPAIPRDAAPQKLRRL
jgi:glycosyltransferase involved in cell wall biosynthesis